MADCCCGSNGKVKLLYACSGSANTGVLSDQVTRTLWKQGVGKMTCLAGVGGRLSGFLASAQAADEAIVIDGCPTSCGKAIFDSVGIAYRHFLITDYGVVKGKTPVTAELIAEVAGKIAKEVQGEPGVAAAGSCR